MSQPDIQIFPNLKNIGLSTPDDKGDDSSIQVDSKSISILIKSPKFDQEFIFSKVQQRQESSNESKENLFQTFGNK